MGEEVTFLRNNTLSRAELSDIQGSNLNIHYGDILVSFNSVIDLEKEKLPRIANEEYAEKLSCNKLQDGDLIIADTAEDRTAGKCVELHKTGDRTVFAGLHTIPCRPRRKYAPNFLSYYINSQAFRRQLIPLMQGIKVISISRSALNGTTLNSPDINEQRKVGEFFKTLDDLIAAHERKLELLRLKKRYYLQQIFSRKLRFRGFTEPWQQRKLKEMAARVNKIGENKNLPCVEYGDIIPDEGSLNKEISSLMKGKKGILFRENDILYGKLRPYLHNWLYPNFSGMAVGDFWVLRAIDIDSSFLYHIVCGERFDSYANLSAGSKMPRADWSLIQQAEFDVPCNIEEQTMISALISCLNDSVTAQQSKLRILKDLKNGYLQILFI